MKKIIMMILVEDGLNKQRSINVIKNNHLSSKYRGKSLKDTPKERIETELK